MQRECRCCGEVKDLYEDYYKIRKNKDGPSAWSYECKVCAKARMKKQHKEKPHIGRKSHLKFKYGITPAEYDVLFEKQGGVCATCGTSEPGPRWTNFAVDHCHTTGKVRGLLCKSCNIALGEMKDNPEVIRSMIKYLENQTDLK